MNQHKDKTTAPDKAKRDNGEIPVDFEGEKMEEQVGPESTEDINEETAAAEPEPEPELPPNWEERFLRLAAEFDNYKKRTAREYSQVIKNAETQLIIELTEVLDNFERALDTDHQQAKLDEFVKGIDLIYGQFKTVLEKRGLTRINAIGEPFDPEIHEAMMQIDSDDIPDGHVAGEIAPGYMLGDRVIRHSKVMVSKGPAKSDDKE